MSSYMSKDGKSNKVRVLNFVTKSLTPGTWST